MIFVYFCVSAPMDSHFNRHLARRISESAGFHERHFL